MGYFYARGAQTKVWTPVLSCHFYARRSQTKVWTSIRKNRQSVVLPIYTIINQRKLFCHVLKDKWLDLTD
jgi:hypothetical protein